MDALTNRLYDLIIVGGGHNGLTLGCLARMMGYRVLIIERREFLGGAAVTRPFKDCPEASNTMYAYLLSMYKRKLIEILKLFEMGLVLKERDPNSATPTADSKMVIFRWKDFQKSLDEIEKKLGKEERDGYVELCEVLGRLAKFIEHVMEMDPPTEIGLAEIMKMYGAYRRLRQLDEDDTGPLMKLMFSSAYDFVTDYITSEPLVGAISSDGIIGADGGPMTPGTGAVLVHHDMGDLAPDGRVGIWYQTWDEQDEIGGMGGFTNTIVKRFAKLGGDVILGIGVKRFLSKMTRKGPVFEGVELEDGRVIRGRACASTIDANQTYSRCDPGHLPPDWMKRVGRIDYTSYSFKINILVKKNGKDHLRWKCGMDTPPGTIHLLESAAYVQQAYEEGRWGTIPKKMMLEVTVPTVQDPFLAPTGEYDVISMFCQYAAKELNEGPWTEERKQQLLENAMAILRQYCNIDDVFICAEVHTPADMERDLGLTGGNIFQGGLGLWQMFNARHLPGWTFKTPIGGLFGAGSWVPPGGGVMGRPAMMALRHIHRYLTGWVGRIFKRLPF